MTAATLGGLLLYLTLAGAACCIAGYITRLRTPGSARALWVGRAGYAAAALGMLGTFATLASVTYGRQYQYLYVWSHTNNDLHGWYRFAATWSAQEGSFLLWAAWSSVIGFLVLKRAGRYEARVMPIFVTVLAFLALILLKQSPFGLVPVPSAADLAAHPEWHYPPINGRGLAPSLVNYWMTIHPPTIFFGFASLAVPFCYAIAALVWRDYDEWTPQVMPYALLSCATLGTGLFMGGYWAYETQGWHGFWGWDPVENASFFPWLAVTALMHGLVVQRSRGGMARTNTFLGIFAFWLFLLGTFLTRSGALAGKDANGQMLSVHAFDNIGKSALSLMIAMMVVYGLGGLGMWLFRLRSMPARKTTGDTMVSRDFAFFLSVTLLMLACVVVMLGTTAPLVQSWMHRPPISPKPAFYNKAMLPLAIITALLMGCVPWLAWRKTKPEVFAQRLIVPWVAMLVFGFFMVFWVQNAERGMLAADAGSTEAVETMRAWINPTVQRVSVVALASLGFLAAFSNAMLATRVFRRKPLHAGGWIAHVGIGLLMIGVIVSNTFERTQRITLEEGESPKSAFGYQFAFDRMTGKPIPGRPINPDYDRRNAIELTVTPPGASDNSPATAGIGDTPRSFTTDLSWFVHNLDTAKSEDQFERMRWPSIKKYFGHDLYIGIADDPGFKLPVITLQPKERRTVGPYVIGYFDSVRQPGKFFSAIIAVRSPDGKVVLVQPGKRMSVSDGGQMQMEDVNVAVPELRDAHGNAGAVYLKSMDARTKAATLLLSLPDYPGHWEVPLEVTFKPWINLVWLGVIIAALGTLLAMTRRIRESRGVILAEEGESAVAADAAQPQTLPVVPAAAINVRGPRTQRAQKRV